jgi:hypothetical protein
LKATAALKLPLRDCAKPDLRRELRAYPGAKTFDKQVPEPTLSIALDFSLLS